MTWNLIRLSDAAATPWRNGGGVTRELASAPTGPEWTWRISVAEVAADGPFSHFPGVQRWFAVLHGNGVRLLVDGQAHEATAASAPFRFDGAASVDCRLLAGATQDLNLMVRQDRASGLMARVHEPRRFAAGAEATIAIFALDGPTTLRAVDGPVVLELPPHSLAWSHVPAGTEVDVATAGALWMEVAPRG